jgi:hypothetical protein
MKTIRKPTQAVLADALGIDPAMVSRHKRQGMPVHSIEAAIEWRKAHVRVRVSPADQSDRTANALNHEQAVLLAGGLLQVAGELIEFGGDLTPMLPALRHALAAVPLAQRDRLLAPIKVLDLLTDEVARVVDGVDQAGTLEGVLQLLDATQLDMGSFWYAVAAGEVRVRLPSG